VTISENWRCTGADAPPEDADPLLWELGQLRKLAQGALAIAKDQAADLLGLTDAVVSGAAEANALSRRVYWLNWILVLIGLAGIIAAGWFWAHPHP